MEQKVVITKNESAINNYLSSGWRVKMVIPQMIAIVSSSSNEKEGQFCFVLEREIQND